MNILLIIALGFTMISCSGETQERDRLEKKLRDLKQKESEYQARLREYKQKLQAAKALRTYRERKKSKMLDCKKEMQWLLDLAPTLWGWCESSEVPDDFSPLLREKIRMEREECRKNTPEFNLRRAIDNGDLNEVAMLLTRWEKYAGFTKHRDGDEDPEEEADAPMDCQYLPSEMECEPFVREGRAELVCLLTENGNDYRGSVLVLGVRGGNVDVVAVHNEELDDLDNKQSIRTSLKRWIARYRAEQTSNIE